MDFESLLQSEAMRPLAVAYSRALLDTPETAAVIARLPAPKAALLYHAALGRAPAEGDRPRAQTAEELCTPIVSAYGLVDTGACTHQRPSLPTLPPLPLSCFDSEEHGGAFQNLERAMAQREASLQASVIASMLAMRAGATNNAALSTPASSAYHA